MFFSMSGESHDAMLRYISYLIQRYEAGSASDAELEHIIAYYTLALITGNCVIFAIHAIFMYDCGS